MTENLFTKYSKNQIATHFLFFIFSIFAGMPLALAIGTLKTWLAELEIDYASIGLFASLSAPYSLKYIFAFFLDKIKLPILNNLLGQRRSWLVILSLAIGASCVLISQTNPAGNLRNFYFVCLALTTSSALFDIVFDAYRIEFFEKNEQALSASTYVFGYRIGMLIAGAGALIIADYYSWQEMYALYGASYLLPALLYILIAPKANIIETKLSKIESSNFFYNSFVSPFVTFAQKNNWLYLLLIIALYKLGEVFLGAMTMPFYIKLGFNKVDIAYIVKSFGFAASMLGAYIGGFICLKLGNLRGLLSCGILQLASNAMFIYLNSQGADLSALTLTVAIEELSGGMGTAALVGFMGGICDKNHTATQFALMTSLTALSRSFLASSSGYLVEILGWNNYFMFTMLAALPALILTICLIKKQSEQS